jgi:TolB-like protein/Tfp pilus assembly protein PilF
MKHCPECNKNYADPTLSFCLEDGAPLIHGEAVDEPATAVLHDTAAPAEGPTRAQIHTTDRSAVLPDRGIETSDKTHSLGKKLAIAVLVLAIIGVGGYFAYRNLSSAGSRKIDSIAVLPFENRSGNADTEYLSDGLSDSLIYRLTQLPNLKVSPTSSVIRYKGKQADVAEIAKELEVDAVMSGKLSQRGDDLTINVELVDTRSKKLIWAEQYDRKMSDLLATQRDIATAIVDKLQLKLVGEQARGITKKYTNSNEAYQLYMKARYHADKRTKPSMLQGVEYYRQAIALDPNFALAYARIAEVYLNLPAYPYSSPGEAVPEGKKAAEKALELDPELSEAHTYMGFYLVTAAWNWTDAEREFKRAIELDPNSADAHFRYGQIYLGPIGRNEEAIKEFSRVLELEPLNINAGNNLAGVYTYARQNDLALAQARKIYDLEPSFPLSPFYLGLAYDAAGKYDDAIALSEKILEEDPTNQKQLRIAGYAYAMSGRRADAERIVKKFAEIEKTDYVMSYWVANIYAALGEKEKAFAELEKAFINRDWELHRLKVDALMAPLRGDPRYAGMLRRLNLSE